MPNQVHGPFAPQTVVNGVTAMNATWGNNAQTQAAVALASLNPDLLTAFVEQGIIASPDAVTANQLDVTAGVAYVTMTDGTVAKINVVSSTQTTSSISTTYNLYLQPDGTWYWSTSNSPQANSLYIAAITTNGAGNISGVTDKRTLLTSLLSGILQGPGVGLLGTVTANTPQPGSNPGTIVGGVTAGQAGGIAGDPDTAMLFDGSTGYITLPANGLPSGNAAWSIECWCKISANPSGSVTLFSFGNQGTTKGAPQFFMTNSGTVILATVAGDTPASAALSVNVWHYLAGTWDGATLKLYVDGAVSQTATPGALSVPSSPAFFTLGATAQAAPNQMYPGTLDEAAIYSTTLSAGQVTAHYNAGHAGSATSSYVRTILGDSPLRYYRLGDASGRGVRQASAATAPVAAADGSVSPTYVAQVAGQATAGNFGVPVIVAAPSEFNITDTVLHDPLYSFSVPAQGLYRVSGSLYKHSGGSSLVYLRTSYSGVHSGAEAKNTFMSISGGGTIVEPLQGAATATVADGEYGLYGPTMYVASGGFIHITYQDLSGTPNDFLLLIIERLT